MNIGLKVLQTVRQQDQFAHQPLSIIVGLLKRADFKIKNQTDLVKATLGAYSSFFEDFGSV